MPRAMNITANPPMNAAVETTTLRVWAPSSSKVSPQTNDR